MSLYSEKVNHMPFRNTLLSDRKTVDIIVSPSLVLRYKVFDKLILNS